LTREGAPARIKKRILSRQASGLRAFEGGRCGLESCALAALLAVCAACTPYGYSKPGVTAQVRETDELECVGIARQQAFIDNKSDRLRAEAAYGPWRWQTAWDFYGVIPSLAELERRYRRVCMLARGYELVPLEEEGERNRIEDVD